MVNRISIRIFYPLLLLLVPLIAMQFTHEVVWSPFDFIIMGALLLLVGLGIDLVIKKSKSLNSRLLYIALIVIVFLLIWAELAVGIFGTPFAGS